MHGTQTRQGPTRVKVGKPAAIKALLATVLVGAALLTWWHTSVPSSGKVEGMLPAVQVMS